MSLAFRHPVLPHQLAAKEVQSCRYIKELKVSWLKKKKKEVEEGILEKRCEKKNCQPTSAGCSYLLFVPACLPRKLVCWGWWQGGWLRPCCTISHVFLAGTRERCNSLDVFMRFCLVCSSWASPIAGSGGSKRFYKVKCNLQRTLPEQLFWVLFGFWLLWVCTQSIFSAASWWG